MLILICLNARSSRRTMVDKCVLGIIDLLRFDRSASTALHWYTFAVSELTHLCDAVLYISTPRESDQDRIWIETSIYRRRI